MHNDLHLSQDPRKSSMFSSGAKAMFLGVICLVVIAIPLMSVTPASAARGLQVATPTATPRADTPPAQATTYVVKPGDSLWSIAAKFYGNGTLYAPILRANNLPDKVVLTVGSILIIPPLNDVPGALPSPTAVPVTATPIVTATPDSTKPAPPNGAVTATATVTSTPSSTPGRDEKRSWQEVVQPFVQMSAYAISLFCFFGSILCAYMSFESYRRSRPYVRRRRIGNRIRVGL